MTTFPPAPLLYQNNLATTFQDSQISYVGYEGTIFHLSGPFAPVLGAQSGAAIVNLAGIDAPFRHLDNKGARQDGTTWYDSLYEPSEIALTVELSGMSPSDMRSVIGSWFGAWSPTDTGKLCWFSPERGEWFCNVRQAKSIQNQFKNDWYQSKRVQFNWVARNDDAFWQGVDSVCQYNNDDNTASDRFLRSDYAGLESNWLQTYTGAGLCATPGSNGAVWVGAGGSNGSVINQYVGSGGSSGADNQFVSCTLGSGMPLPAVGVVVTVTASGGTFTLSYGDQTTSAIAYNASISAVDSALEALSTIGTGNVTITGTAGNYTITLSSSTKSAGAISANGALLTGTTPSVIVTGNGVSNAVTFSSVGSAYILAINIFVSSGSYTLSFGGQTTTAITYSSNASTIKTALEALSTVGAGKVTVTAVQSNFPSLWGYAYTIQFASGLSASAALTVSMAGTNTAWVGLALPGTISGSLPAPNFATDLIKSNPAKYAWYENYSGLGLSFWGPGTLGIVNGAAAWNNAIGLIGEQCVAVYQTPTSSDSQTVSITLSGASMNTNFDAPCVSLQARCNQDGSSYVFANIYNNQVTIGYAINGSTSTLSSQAFTYTAGTYRLVCNGINYSLIGPSGSIILQCFDGNQLARIGSGYHYTGFGVYAGYNITNNQTGPGVSVTSFSSQDNYGHTFLDLWGRMDTVAAYTITGPGSGTYTVSANGNTSSSISYNASATTVQNALASVGLNASVSGTGPWTATFSNSVTSALTASNATVSYAPNQDGIRARFGYNWSTLCILSGGTLTQVWQGSTLSPLVAGDVVSLQCGVIQPGFVGQLENFFTGTNYNPRQFQILHNGKPLIVPTNNTNSNFFLDFIAKLEDFFGVNYGYTDTSSSKLGVGYRGWGFGMSAAGTGGTQVGPASVSVWSGGSDSGFLTLTNIGDQPGWPRYLCYGPGSFVIGDGDSGNTVTFGPLLPGQVALLSTQPRLQTVVDVTPGAVTSNIPTGAPSLYSTVNNFARNSNLPPLVQQFESWFGVTPPQGPLYSLLNGRFTMPLPPMFEQEGPVPTYIPCQIRGGTNQSKIIASVTPYRRWPE